MVLLESLSKQSKLRARREFQALTDRRIMSTNGTTASAERTLTLKDDVRKECEELVARFPKKDGALLNVFRILEREFGYLDAPAVKIAADICEMPPAKAWGTMTFYSTFKKQSDGENIIWVCSTLPCALRGSEALYDHLKNELDLDENGTSKDGKISLKKAECLGACGTAPCLQLNHDYYEKLSHDDASRIVKELQNGNPRPAGFTA